MNCKNCNFVVKSNFCPNCGQNIRVEKLTLQSFLTELTDSVFQLNYGLLYTIKSLFVRPGHAIREFLNGQRKEYFKPIAYALALSTLYFLVARLSDNPTMLEDALSGYSRASENLGDKFIKSSILIWLTENYAYTNLLLIPVFSLASFICFNGLDRNFLEHIVINSFVTGQQALIYSVFMTIGLIVNYEDLMDNFAFLVVILYNFWAFLQFFYFEKNFTLIARLLLTYIVFAIFLIIVFAIIA